MMTIDRLKGTIMFHIGDPVIHPNYGPGKVISIEQVSCLGSGKRYYEFELLESVRKGI